jgi:competence protein ComEC
VVALPANLVALPAVAPVMWLGMLAAAAGQLAWLPVEPLTWLAGLLAAYIAQVASWCAAPGWSQAEAGIRGPVALVATYLALGTAIALVLRWAARRRSLRPGTTPRPRQGTARVRHRGALAAAAVALIALTLAPVWRPGAGPDADPGLRITVLDVGQGDSILLEPAGAVPILVDAGPAEADVAGQLTERGVERLAALVVTHPEADHDGGAATILERIPTDRLVFARAGRTTLATARAFGTQPVRIAGGARLRAGGLRLEVLWPPAERLEAGHAAPLADPNSLSLVLLARWRGFEALLTGDAEAEAAPLDPGPVDVLKLAHHGSEDAGLDRLLDRAEPRLAMISVGGDNPYGHPSAATLATLAEHGVPVLRTDRDGEITIEAARGAWAVR